MHTSYDKETAKFTQIEILYNIQKNKCQLEIKEPLVATQLYLLKVCYRITEVICLEQQTHSHSD